MDNFLWQTQNNTIASRAKFMLQTELITDCNVSVGKEPNQKIFKCHKILLAMASPVFFTMFYRSFCGSKKYMVDDLVTKCVEYLTSSITPPKACHVYEIAVLFEETALMVKCMELICTNTGEVFNDPSWEDIKYETLLTICKQDFLEFDEDDKLLVAVDKWAKAECRRKKLDPLNTDCLRSVVKEALTEIKLEKLSPQQFANCVKKISLLTKDEIIAIFMNVSLENSEIPMPIFTDYNY